jgi:hypothetical protein
MNPIGVQYVREFVGTCAVDKVRGLFVAPGGFTPAAKKFAAKTSTVTLLDADGLEAYATENVDLTDLSHLGEQTKALVIAAAGAAKTREEAAARARLPRTLGKRVTDAIGWGVGMSCMLTFLTMALFPIPMFIGLVLLDIRDANEAWLVGSILVGLIGIPLGVWSGWFGSDLASFESESKIRQEKAQYKVDVMSVFLKACS